MQRLKPVLLIEQPVLFVDDPLSFQPEVIPENVAFHFRKTALQNIPLWISAYAADNRRNSICVEGRSNKK
jgi:hypothetical protein